LHERENSWNKYRIFAEEHRAKLLP
jgi:hypothetical protein